ncbi:MAG: hypothetical protein JJ979_27415 [Roseibium sp.]|nr:hypothetical protein [Roseibium sp.]
MEDIAGRAPPRDNAKDCGKLVRRETAVKIEATVVRGQLEIKVVVMLPL